MGEVEETEGGGDSVRSGALDESTDVVFRHRTDTAESDLLLPEDSRESPPRDRFNAVYLVFYLLGMGTLLPWNFFISVNSYWDYKFRDVNATANHNSDAWYGDEERERTKFQKNFGAYLAIASNVPNAVFVMLNAALGQRFPFVLRVLASSSVVIVFFVAVTILSEVDSDSWQFEFMVMVLAIVVVINCATAVFQGSIFGMAGPFPPKYMGAVMAGQAMGGIFPSVVGIIVVALRISPKDSGFSSFFIATVFLVASFIGFLWVTKVPFYRFYAPTDVSDATATTASSALSSEEEDDDDELSDREIARSNEPDLIPPTASSVPSTTNVIAAIWPFCAVVFFTFAQTISVFPAVTELIESTLPEKSLWTERYFSLVTCFLLFNVGDYSGRILSSRLQWPQANCFGKSLLGAVTLLRTAFIPLFMYCNAAPQKRRTEVLISSDAVYIVLMCVFAISNGYLGNISMIHGPRAFESKQHQEAAAMVLVACLVLGVGLGSVISYGTVSLL